MPFPTRNARVHWLAVGVLCHGVLGAQVGGGGGTSGPPKPKQPDSGYEGPGDTTPPPAPPSVGGSAATPGVVPQQPHLPVGDAATGLTANSSPSSFVPSTAPASTPATWFDWNLEPLLRVRARARDTRLRTAGALDDAPLDATALVSARVIPALLDTYASSQEPTLARAALFGLARLAEESDAAARARVRATLEGALAHSNADIALAATVALGVYGSDEQAVTLANVLGGGAAAAPARQGAVGSRLRAGAALALALVGQRSTREDVRRFVVHNLARGLQRVDFGDRELDAACALGLGLVPLRESGRPSAGGLSHAAASREEQIAALTIVLHSKDADRVVRAHAAVSLARMFDPRSGLTVEREAVLSQLVQSCQRNRGVETEVLQGMLLALGRMTDSGTAASDVAARDTLAAASGHADPVARGLALVALAEAAARKGPGQDPLAGLPAAEKQLLRELERGRSGVQGWAALGLGMLARARAEAGLAPSSDVLEALARAASESQSSNDRAAIDLARGLARDAAATADLERDALTGRDPIVRAAATLALGFSGANSSADGLRMQLADVGVNARVTENTAVALVLLGDPDVATRLVDLVRKTGSLERQAALLEGVGRSGDDRVVSDLLELLAEADRGPQSRAFVVRALSRVSDRNEMPWYQGLVHGSNLEVETEFMNSEQGLLAMTRW